MATTSHKQSLKNHIKKERKRSGSKICLPEIEKDITFDSTRGVARNFC